MKRLGIPPSRPANPTPRSPGGGEAADPEPSPEQKLRQALCCALWRPMGTAADDVVLPWMSALQGNELHLEAHPADAVASLAPTAWEAYAELAAARGQGISSVFLPPGLRELPNGLEQLRHLSYMELPDFRGNRLDCRWDLHPDVGELTLKLPGCEVTEILAPAGCTIRCPGGDPFPIRVQPCERASGRPTGLASKAQGHIYFREPREFVPDGGLPSRQFQRGILESNLNGKATFPGSGKSIHCAELAYQWLCDRLTRPPGRFSYADYGSVDRIAGHVSSTASADFERFLARGPAGSLFSLDHWGRFLAREFAQLQPDGPERLFMLHIPPNPGYGPGHAMGMSLRVKTTASPDAPLQYVLDFYDPNHSKTHRRISEARIEPMRALSMAELMPVDVYYEDLDAEDRILRAIPFAAPLPQTSADDGKERRLDTTLLPTTHRSYFELLLYEIADASPAQVVERLAGPPPSDLVHLLDADGECPLLGLAASSGRANFIRGATHAVMNSESLSPSEKLQIVHDTGSLRPAIHLALSHASIAHEWGYPDAVAALMECLLHPAMAEWRLEMLSFVDEHGQSLLHTAFGSGANGKPAASLLAFVRPLLACDDLRDEDKTALLSLRDIHGESALQRAAREGQHEAAAAFAAEIAGSGLHPDCKAAVLAMDERTDEGVLAAMRKAVAESAPSDEERAMLLAALHPR